MIDELQKSLTLYQEKWQALSSTLADADFFGNLKPTAVAWKAKDVSEFDEHFHELRHVSSQVHLGWVNERWLATFYLREPLPNSGVRLVKLMQRRPGSTDPVGLDHLDFILPKGSNVKSKLASESNIEWTEERNGDHCKWISIWFAGTEAKLRSDTVLAVCCQELEDADRQIDR